MLQHYLRLFLIANLTATLLIGYYSHPSLALTQKTMSKNLVLNDPALEAKVVFKGLNFPTSMALLGPNDILILEKNNGTVQRIVNGTMLPKPLLDVNISSQGERGMLGIAIAKNQNLGSTYVFLYFTQSAVGKDSDDYNSTLANRIYRYELVNDKLVNAKLLLDLPSKPGPYHNGGKISIGPDANLYAVIGDLNGHRTKAQNVKNGTEPDGTSAIYRITQDGKIVKPTIFGGIEPLNKFYAYGMRNSFGLDFDPVTGRLWDTETGPGFGEEINLVEPGFNSGWRMVQGIWERNASNPSLAGEIASSSPDDLVDFGGRGKYSPPELTSFTGGLGFTSIKFLNSDKLGKQYENDLFVADFHYGIIMHFDLNKKRNALVLNEPLKDKVAYNIQELQNVTFGYGFGGITDIEVGPDGYLYILSLQQSGGNCETEKPSSDCIQYSSPIAGTIYKIVPTS